MKKISYEQFLKIILTFKKINNDFNELYDMGFDFNNGKYRLEHSVEMLLDNILDICFNDLEKEVIYWFILDNEYGQKDWSKSDTYYKIEKDSLHIHYFDSKTKIKYGLYDENGNMICTSTEDLYKFVTKHHDHEKTEINSENS